MSVPRWVYRKIINPPTDLAMQPAVRRHTALLPTIWLLGKTGSGKSSVIQKLTGETNAEIGSGFEPCTATASVYQHPQEHPVIRFLDTRGLGEVAYDPAEDIAQALQSSHALLALMRVDDTEQSVLLDTLSSIVSKNRVFPIVLVHTALHQISDTSDRQRAIEFNHRQAEDRLQRTLPVIPIDFTLPEDGISPHDFGIDELRAAIIDLMPALHLLHSSNQARDREQTQFDSLRSQVYWYAGVAAASDALPAVGLVTVPGIQGKMLHSLAQHYGIEWTSHNVSQLLGALGGSVLYRYTLSLGGRQLVKLVPGYGQTAGAAAAASISFASTFALGRAACKYLYARQTGVPWDNDEIRKTYQDVLRLRSAPDGPGHEKIDVDKIRLDKR